MPPAEAEDAYYASLEELKIAAGLKLNSLRENRDNSDLPPKFRLLNIDDFSLFRGSLTPVGRFDFGECQLNLPGTYGVSDFSIVRYP